MHSWNIFKVKNQKTPSVSDIFISFYTSGIEIRDNNRKISNSGHWIKKFHDRFPTKQKNLSFKISGGKFLVLASSALGIISPLHWGSIKLRNPRAFSAHPFPLWKCAWVAGETAGSSATENERKMCWSCTLSGPVPYCSPVFWQIILNFCQRHLISFGSF